MQILGRQVPFQMHAFPCESLMQAYYTEALAQLKFCTHPPPNVVIHPDKKS